MPRKPARRSRKLNKKRKRGFSWKVSRNVRKTKKKAAKVGAAVFIVAISFVFLLVLFAYKSVTVPFASASSTSSDDIFSKGYITSLLVSIDSFDLETPRTKVILLTIYDIDDGKIHVYSIPGDLKVDMPGRLGVEDYSRILPLSVSVHNGDLDSGIQDLVISVQKTTALKVDGYTAVEEGLWDEVSDALLYGKPSGLFSMEKLKALNNSLKTSHNLSTVYKMYSFAGRVGESSIEFNDYGSSFYSDEYALDQDIQKITFDSVISEENKSISILNGAEQPGLAGFGSRVAKNFGGRVISVENAKYTYGESVIIADDVNTYTVRELSNIFGIDSVIEKGSPLAVEIDESEIPRSDVTVIFGFDMLETL